MTTGLDQIKLSLRRTDWVVASIIGLCCLIETALVAADLGLIGSRLWRSQAYQFGGFWPGLLRDWQANYPTQPYAMFGSYAFLHGGWVHLVINMITLYSLGHAILDRVGRLGFLAVYLAAILGGAAGYGLLNTSPQPMVGASGALFGLAGAWVAWLYIDRFAAQIGLWPVARIVALLIAMNIVMWWAMDGQLAWQTHLGGFVAGWIMALLLDPRARPEDL